MIITMKISRKFLIVASVITLSAIGGAQLKQVIEIFGVGAAVKQFAPQINGAINKLTGHKDTARVTTKIVPIISGGISSRQAVGAAQVIGPKSQVNKVQAVAQIDQDLFGREIKIRAMIPIATKDIQKEIHAVEGVGVSGTVDLKL